MWMDDYGDDSQIPSVQDWDGNKIIGDFYHNLAKEDGVYKDVYGVPDCVTGRLFQETGKMTLEVIKRHLTSVDKILQLCGTRMCPAAKLRFCSGFETSNTSLHENIICDLDLRCILQIILCELVRTRVCVYVCMYVCIYTYIYICTYIHKYIFTCI